MHKNKTRVLIANKLAINLIFHYHICGHIVGFAVKWWINVWLLPSDRNLVHWIWLPINTGHCNMALMAIRLPQRKLIQLCWSARLRIKWGLLPLGVIGDSHTVRLLTLYIREVRNTWTEQWGSGMKANSSHDQMLISMTFLSV